MRRLSFPWSVFALAAAARLAFLLLWEAKNLEAVFPHDPYPDVALSWLGWGPYVEPIYRPPLYSAVLAALFWVSGAWRAAVVPVLQCLLSAACPALLYAWARRVVGGDTARLAALWMAVDPPLIFFAPQYQTETFFVFMVLCFFLSVYQQLEQPKDARSLATGVLGGLTALTRGVFLPYSLFFAAALARLKRWRLLTLIALGWALVVFTWAARNYRYYHEIVLVSAQSGWNMWEGFTLDREELKRRPYEMSAEQERMHAGDPFSSDRYWKKRTSQFIHEHPREAAKIVFLKAFRYWRPWPYDPYSGAVRWIIGVYFTIVLGFAACGALSLKTAGGKLLPVYGLFICLTILHSLYFTSLRYRLPLEPFLCFFAAAGVLKTAKRA